MLMRDEIKAAVEAILFVRADRVNGDELVEILDVPWLDLKEILQELIIDYNNKKRGLQIVVADNTYLMCTHPACSDILSRMTRTVRRRLSPAALETLAIVAYHQPVTRAEIEQIRGVKADKGISQLMERGLVEEAGYKEAVGKPLQYATTLEFLRIFGLASLDALPDLQEEKSHIRKIPGRRN